jgi:putative endonuclease
MPWWWGRLDGGVWIWNCHPEAVVAMTIRHGLQTLKIKHSMWKRLRKWFADIRSASALTTGAFGERVAADFLVDAGFKIVARNWRSPRDRRDEIDLVCRDGEVLVFVEVKARASTALVPGYFTVDARKKKVLRRAATAYMRQLHPPPATFRLDVLEVITHVNAEPEVRHVANVPLFPKHFRP